MPGHDLMEDARIAQDTGLIERPVFAAFVGLVHSAACGSGVDLGASNFQEPHGDCAHHIRTAFCAAGLLPGSLIWSFDAMCASCAAVMCLAWRTGHAAPGA